MLYDKKWELDETGKILMKAADYLEEHGHTKNRNVSHKGEVCLHGAINAAVYGDPRSSRHEDECQNAVVKRAFDYLTSRGVSGVRCSSGFYGMAEWNDMPERTKQEVVDALREAAFYQLPVTV